MKSRPSFIPARLLLAAMATLSTLAHSEEGKTAPARQAITLHPISSLVVTGFSLAYEKPISPRLALEIPLYFGVNKGFYEESRLFAGSGIGARIYLTRPDAGGYVAPLFEFVDMYFFEDKETGTEGGNTLITLTWLRYGYKFLWNHFTLDLGMGFGWGQTFYGSLDGAEDPATKGLLPMGHCAIGVPF